MKDKEFKRMRAKISAAFAELTRLHGGITLAAEAPIKRALQLSTQLRNGQFASCKPVLDMKKRLLQALFDHAAVRDTASAAGSFAAAQEALTPLAERAAEALLASGNLCEEVPRIARLLLDTIAGELQHIALHALGEASTDDAALLTQQSAARAGKAGRVAVLSMLSSVLGVAQTSNQKSKMLKAKQDKTSEFVELWPEHQMQPAADSASEGGENVEPKCVLPASIYLLVAALTAASLGAWLLTVQVVLFDA